VAAGERTGVGSRSPVESAQLIAAQAHELAPQIERERALPGELVAALLDAGLLHLCLPRALGGLEVEPREMVLAFEELARGDGATSWCSMIASTSGLVGAYLNAADGARVYGNARNILAGVFAPRGRARREGDSYRVSGRWSFVSGVGHCDWLMVGCLIENDDGPELLENGSPNVRLMLMEKQQVEVLDTWSVSGLCGTGSHDIQIADVMVPASLAVSLFTDPPQDSGALYAFPLFGLLALGICSVALGIARGAIDELVSLAGGKRPAPGARSLAERGTIQSEVARAEAKLRSARAFVLEQADEAWSAARSGAPLSAEHRRGLRLAATHGTWAASEVVGAMYHAGGGGAIYSDSSLQRSFRDVNVATQHVMVAPPTWELTGRLYLGVPTDITQL
jgi:alkylation response protein AidB-like acyl-CoA dehydrogenase